MGLATRASVSPLLLALALVAGACRGGPEGDAVPREPVTPGASETPEEVTPVPPPTPVAITADEQANADLVLMTGETIEDTELGGYAFAGEALTSPGPEIRVGVGKPVTIALENVHGYVDAETIDHDLVVVGRKAESAKPLWGARTEELEPGQADVITFTPDEPGRFFYICSLATYMSGHGMWGRFVVEAR